MIRILPLLSPLLIGCASTLPPSLSTSRMVDAQQALFEGRGTVEAVREYEPLCEAQREIVVTNIVVRQDVAMGRYDQAVEGLKTLCPNYCIEGPSYDLFYVKWAFDWWNKTHGGMK